MLTSSARAFQGRQQFWRAMHIKRIELCGFKSYRDVTVVDDLDEGYNVIGQP
jgi:hypothetical protein